LRFSQDEGLILIHSEHEKKKKFSLKNTIRFLFIVKFGVFSGMGNINNVPGKKMTIWCNYRFTYEQTGIFHSNGLNFVEI